MIVQKRLKSVNKAEKTRHTQPFLGLLISGLLLLTFVLPSVVWSLPGIEDEKLLELYRTGRYGEVVSVLGDSNTLGSMESLYLGLSYLRLGESIKAIRAWQSYVRLEQGSEGGRKISKYLTILLQQEAKRLVKEQLQNERDISRTLNPKAIAVYPFANKGTSTYAPLSKGLAAMIMTDLSQVKGITVVERVQIQAVFNELRLSKSGLLDSKSAPRLGKLVGAAKFTTGSFLDLDQEKMRLDATIIKTESGEQLAVTDAAGDLKSFYQIEKILVFKLLCGLGYCPESLDSRTRLAVEKIHTKNLKAFQFYSEGLDHLDQEQYRKAAQSFVQALEEDPTFELARGALLDTPILALNIGTMISGAEAISQVNDAIPPVNLVTITSPVFHAAVPVTPQIFQQPTTETITETITETSAGSPPPPPPTSAPVQIEINFP